MRNVHFIVFSAFIVVCFSQRSPYAGLRPIGYPALETTVDPLGNRFGEGGTTERLPLEAMGDRELVNRLSKLPIDQQPFWLLNWKALEEHRNNPQIYEQRPNPFANIPGSSNSVQNQQNNRNTRRI